MIRNSGSVNLFRALVVLALCPALPMLAQQGGVVNTVHNLSASGPGEIKSADETRICRFCHIPHNAASPRALWSQTLSKAEYVTAEIRTDGKTKVRAPQPNGESRLCLSCHDGTVALGSIAGQPMPTSMRGAQRLLPGRRGHLGTDLSGSHPISFVVPDVDADPRDTGRDMGIKPRSAIRGSNIVKLDAKGRMQCTTCHDPHDDSNYREGSVPRFWVAGSVNEVCLTCHALR